MTRDDAWLMLHVLMKGCLQDCVYVYAIAREVVPCFFCLSFAHFFPSVVALHGRCAADPCSILSFHPQAAMPPVQQCIALHALQLTDSVLQALVDSCPRSLLRQPLVLLYFLLQHPGARQGVVRRLTEAVGQQGFGGASGKGGCLI